MLSRHFKSLLSSPQKRLLSSQVFSSTDVSGFNQGKTFETTPLTIETFEVPRIDLHNSDVDNKISKTEIGVDLLDPRYSTMVITTARLRDKIMGVYVVTKSKVSSYATTLSSDIGSKSDEPKVNTVSDSSGPRLAAVKSLDKTGLEQKWESVKQQLPGWQTKIAEVLQTIQDIITRPKRASGKKE